MSQIDTRHKPVINGNPTQGLQKSTETRPSNGAAGTSFVRNVRGKLSDSFKIRSTKTSKLTSATQVSEIELQPLAGRKRDQMVGDLTRVLRSIREIESEDGEDETSKLCKIMLQEQIRRLMLIDGTQVEPDELKGSA